MGLDMYLEGNMFVSDFGDAEANANKLRSSIKESIGETPGKVTNLVTEAAYWRKANAIHAWFVEQVQEGVDECHRTYVSREQLNKLRAICKKVIDKPDVAEVYLPVQAGFFFGETEYDEYYFDTLKDTIEQLDVVLDEKKYPEDRWDFYYQSSW